MSAFYGTIKGSTKITILEEAFKKLKSALKVGKAHLLQDYIIKIIL